MRSSWEDPVGRMHTGRFDLEDFGSQPRECSRDDPGGWILASNGEDLYSTSRYQSEDLNANKVTVE